MMQQSDALWYVSSGQVELRPGIVDTLRDGDVLIGARYSAISRGTERLVLRGHIPSTEHDRMRCPHQEGSFPFPVKYGYAVVGKILAGPADRIGQAVFALHPHQRQFCIPSEQAHIIPEGLPFRRATLAANMETALNIVWDAGIAPGDHVLIIGGGTVGILTAALAARSAGTRVTIVDIDPSRAGLAEKVGAQFALPYTAPAEQDVVIHTSASEEGLRLALSCAGIEARVIEASWYGDKDIKLNLGEAFHSRRLKLLSSQVGTVPAHQRARWPTSRRLKVALELLCNSVFDALLTQDIAFDDAPAQLAQALAADSSGLTTVLTYT